MSQEVIVVIGCQASGKTSLTKELMTAGNYQLLNRDTEGGKIIDLLPKMEQLLKNKQSVILDNTFPTIEVRKPFIEMASRYQIPIRTVWLSTSIEDATFNFVQRAIGILGTFPEPELVKKSKHPNIFPPTVLFRYRKEFQKPTIEEGFASVEERKFARKDDPTFTGKACFLDFDGTLRECVGGNGKYPIDKSHIVIKPNVAKTLQRYKDLGYILLGVSNQSGVAKGELTHQTAVELFEHTNKLIGHDIDVRFCPHQSAPISCYCRKPQTGLFVEAMMKHKLKRSDCYFVGDMTSDATFAKRAGIQYIDQAEFFK